MFNIRRVMYKIGGALLAVLFVLISANPVFATADADQESPFKTHLSDVKVKDQNEVPQDTTTDTAIPPIDGVNPDGNHQGQNQIPNPNGEGNVSTPTNEVPNSNQNAGTQTDGTSTDGINIPSPNPIDGTTTNGTNIDPTHTDGTKTESTSTDPADQANVSAPDNRPWYEKLWDKAKDIAANPIESLQNFGKGAAAGAVGAGVVIIAAVVIFAVVLSAPISVPVLIVAGVVGIVAGGIYGLMAGDNFEFIKGIGYGALGAISVIGIAQSGIVGAVRGGWTFFRSQGTKLFLKEVGKKSLGYVKGLGKGLWDAGRGLVTSPIQSLKTAITSKTTITGFTINAAVGFFNKLAFDGQLPDLKESGVILLESVAGALVFDKVADILKKPAISNFGKSVSGFFGGMIESLSITKIKSLIDPKENKSILEQSQSGVIKSMILTPIFGRALKNLRTKNSITTTTSDLEERGIEVSQSNVGNKSITHRQLDMIWNNRSNQNTVNRWQNNHNSSLTQAQYDRLLEQEKALQNIKNPLDITQKISEESLNKGTEWLSNDNPSKSAK